MEEKGITAGEEADLHVYERTGSLRDIRISLLTEHDPHHIQRTYYLLPLPAPLRARPRLVAIPAPPQKKHVPEQGELLTPEEAVHWIRSVWVQLSRMAEIFV